MSQQGPILIVSNEPNAPVAAVLADAKVFPVIDTDWSGAPEAVRRMQPAAVIATNCEDNKAALATLAQQIDALRPRVALIALDPKSPLPANAVPFTQTTENAARLAARLNAALRVRVLHTTVLRRLADENSRVQLPDNDPLLDATVLLIGRGASFPALSIALGEQIAVVGALSIEAAAKHLNAREFDGVVIGEGFSPRVVDAFLTVLTEDSRFRNLPVVLAATAGLAPDYDLPNLEITTGLPQDLAANALPLIRQHSFESRLRRVLKSIDVGGLLDPRTGLLTQDAFERDLANAVRETLTRGAGLAVAKFAFPAMQDRLRFDAARIMSRLMRRMDFATLYDDNSIIAVFAETDLRTAGMIARRLASVMKHTLVSPKREQRLDPDVSLTALLPQDSVESMLARLSDQRRRAVS